MFWTVVITIFVVLYIKVMIYFFRKYSKEELYGERKDTKPEIVNGVEKSMFAIGVIVIHAVVLSKQLLQM